jgi:hypothetical protein
MPMLWLAALALALGAACSSASPPANEPRPVASVTPQTTKPATPRARSSGPTSPDALSPCGVTARIPRWRHVVWIVMENKSYAEIVGNAAAPYENAQAAKCGLATAYHGVAHPSLPNYIAMTSGSTQGITDDNPPSAHPLAAPSLFSQLGSHWSSLQESMPSNCDQASSGEYAVKHDPAAYFTDLRSACLRQDIPLGSQPDLASTFTFVTPNLCNDMHDCSVSTGDGWLSTFLPKVLDSVQYRAGNTAVFVTFDEDDGSAANHVPMLVLAPSVPAGTRSAGSFDHYSLLRTTEEMLGLKRLGAAAGAPSMRSAFHL